MAVTECVLITGGAGFIGSFVADEMLSRGYRVRVLDDLSPQVHGPQRLPPDYLDPDVEVIVGDVRDPHKVAAALDGIDGVFHFAAAVGVGQSMYAVEHYVETNCVGTAVLLEAVATRRLKRLVVASSMSIYGEGLCARADGTPVVRPGRPRSQLVDGIWEVLDESGEALRPLPTPENKPPDLASIYALTKYDQERMCTLVGDAYGVPTTALRFFNVYGPRQALSNPYTGVLAIFASRLLNDRPPIIFEDGRQRRDFVSVHDVARACRLAYESDRVAGEVLNIGSGQARTITEVARALGRILGKEALVPEVPGEYRVGDIRHCFADIGRARTLLGYEPRISFDDGLEELAEWLDGRTAVDRVVDARRELERRGLTVGRLGD